MNICVLKYEITGQIGYLVEVVYSARGPNFNLVSSTIFSNDNFVFAKHCFVLKISQQGIIKGKDNKCF